MGERQIELTIVKVGIAYDRYHSGDIVVQTTHRFDSGDERNTSRRVPLGRGNDLERSWDRVFDEVLRAQHLHPAELQLRLDGSGMGEWLPDLIALVRIVAYELKVASVLTEAAPAEALPLDSGSALGDSVPSYVGGIRASVHGDMACGAEKGQLLHLVLGQYIVESPT